MDNLGRPLDGPAQPGLYGGWPSRRTQADRLYWGNQMGVVRPNEDYGMDAVQHLQREAFKVLIFALEHLVSGSEGSLDLESPLGVTARRNGKGDRHAMQNSKILPHSPQGKVLWLPFEFQLLSSGWKEHSPLQSII